MELDNPCSKIEIIGLSFKWFLNKMSIHKMDFPYIQYLYTVQYTMHAHARTHIQLIRIKSLPRVSK